MNELKRLLDELDYKYGHLDIQKPYYYNQDDLNSKYSNHPPEDTI